MTQFDFTTNIELRVPGTGKVYMIDRMTSDWAERHPLNVDQMIEDVYQEFAGTEFEESRESLRKVWTATLQMPKQGDKSVYPNNNGARRAAAMKVWMLAGDYWRRGLRLGDVLPERCPSHKITRLLDGGWIALSPKDMHLLEDHTETTALELCSLATDGTQEITESTLPKIDDAVLATEEHAGDTVGTGSTCDVSDVTLVPVPICNPHSVPEPVAVCSPKTERERNAEQRRRRREQREAQRRNYEERLEREAREAEEYARQQERRKIFAAVGAAAVTLVMIYFFGLLGPAVFGLLCGGLLKG